MMGTTFRSAPVPYLENPNTSLLQSRVVGLAFFRRTVDPVVYCVPRPG